MSDAKSYSEHRPYPAPPGDLADLVGPMHGTVELPITIDWGPRRVYDLGTEVDRRILYERVLREAGSTEEVCRWVNGRGLVMAWAHMWLPARIRAQWEARFPELRRPAA